MTIYYRRLSYMVTEQKPAKSPTDYLGMLINGIFSITTLQLQSDLFNATTLGSSKNALIEQVHLLGR